MSNTAEDSSEYVRIPILRPTRDIIEMECPKAWTYDRFMNELIEIWRNYKKSGVKLGKSAQSNP